MSSTVGGASPPGWLLWSNGSVFTRHPFFAGKAKISIIAKGDVAAATWPTMNVEVAGKQVGSASVTSATYNQYEFSITVGGGSQDLRLKFSNDLKTQFEDRNLYVDSVTVSQACDP